MNLKVVLLCVNSLFVALVLGQEFKLRYIDSTSPPQLIKIQHPADCIPAHISDHDYLMHSKIFIYSPISTGVSHLGILLTSYSVSTSCDVNFWGSQSKTIEQDTTISLNSLPKNFVERVIAKLEQRADSPLKDWTGSTEISVDDFYDCSWMKTKHQNFYMIRSIPVSTVWHPRGFLIQPSRNKNCTLGESKTCSLTDKSILIPPRENKEQACRLTEVAVLEGLITWIFKEKLTEISFTTLDNKFKLTFTHEDNLLPVCQNSEKDIWVSEEGHLFGFDRTSVKDDLNKILNLKTNNRSKSRITKREVVEELILELPPPELNQHYNRTKRAVSIWEYPEYQRLQYLEERTAWGMSEISAFSQDLSEKLTSSFMNLIHQVCLNRYNNLVTAIQDEKWDSYLQIILENNQFLLIGKTQTGLILKRGRPVSGLYYDTTNTIWCDGNLVVDYTMPDSKAKIHGILIPNRGIILDLPERCKSVVKPDHFYIPTFQNGSYDVISGIVQSEKYSIELPTIHWHFMILMPDTGKEMMEELEIAQEHSTGVVKERSFLDSLEELIIDDKVSLSNTILSRLMRIGFWISVFVLTYLMLQLILRIIFSFSNKSGAKYGRARLF